MKTPNNILMILALSSSMVACELGDFSDIGEGEMGDLDAELAEAIDEAEANAELPPPIIAGGRPDDRNHLSVGYMHAPVASGGIATCSGQLITPTLFLTAAHCIDAVNTNRIPWNKVKIGWGEVNANYAVNASRGWKNPKYNGKVGSPFDMGLIVLSRRPPYIPFATIGRARVGQLLQIVGYGRGTTNSTSWNRRSAEVVVSSRLANGVFQTIGTSGRTCGGDSGGGALNPNRQNQVMLLTSYGPEGCSQFGATGHVDPRRDGNWQPLAYVGAKFD